jgi:hypothetical protein
MIAGMLAGLALAGVVASRTAAQASPAPSKPIPGCASVARKPAPPLPRMPTPPRLVLGAGGALGVLNLPKLALGPALFAEIDVGWPLDLGLSYLLPNEAEVSDRELDLGAHPIVFFPFPADGSRIDLSLLQASAGICPLRHWLTSGRLLGCAGLYGGMLSASGEGFVAAGDATRFLAGAEAYARWHFRIAGPVGLTYSAGVFVPFLREPFGYIDRDGEFRKLFRQPAIGGRLDVLLAFWLE